MNRNERMLQFADVLEHAYEKGYRQSRHYLVDPKDPKHTCALGVILQECYGWDGKIEGGQLGIDENGIHTCVYLNIPFEVWKRSDVLKRMETLNCDVEGGSGLITALNDSDAYGDKERPKTFADIARWLRWRFGPDYESRTNR